MLVITKFMQKIHHFHLQLEEHRFNMDHRTTTLVTLHEKSDLSLRHPYADSTSKMLFVYCRANENHNKTGETI